MKRREFLKKTGAACVAVGFVPACGEDADCSDASLISAEASDGLVRLPSTALADAGGSVRVQAGGHKIVLARLKSGDVTGVSWVCTHAGCTVCFEDGAQEFACPCHGSRFKPDGRRAAGPARRALQEYPVTEEGEELIIDISVTPAA